ncbi:MAG TPA: MFS transporter, partial [Vicinamibacterales bacterium]
MMLRSARGWIVIAVAAAAMVGTLPGRTQGLGLITEPLLRDLGASRVAYAQINLWATLIGALGAVGIGRFIDRAGTRPVLTIVAALLGLIVIGMSRVESVAAVFVWVTLTRAVGQSALSVVSLALMGRTFVRRPDVPMAIYTIALSVGFMFAFPAVGSMVQARGWRTAWAAIGIALLAGLAPAGWFLLRGRPDEAAAPDDPHPAAEGGMSHGAALRTGAFWTFATGAAVYGLVASGIGLFNESILAERGFDAHVYYQTLVVTAMTALAGNFLGGWLATRVRPGHLLAAAMVILAGGLAWLPFVRALPEVYAWAAAMGLGGGGVTVLFFAIWPRVFGRR